MAMWIIAGMLASVAFGFPVTFVLVAGTFCMCGVTFALTRDTRIAQLGVGFLVITFNHLLIKGLETHSSLFQVPEWAAWLGNDLLLGVIACVIIAISMFLGLFGPLRNLPLDPQGIIEKVKARQNQKGKDDQ